MAIRDPRLIVLLDEVWKRLDAAQGDEMATQTLVGQLQKALGVNTSDLLQKSGWIQKAANDPEPGVMTRLPLRDALNVVGVAIEGLNDVTGLHLRCVRCGARWTPGYEAGDVRRPAGKFWLCPSGCNATHGTLPWDQGKPLSYNPLFGYK